MITLIDTYLINEKAPKCEGVITLSAKEYFVSEIQEIRLDGTLLAQVVEGVRVNLRNTMKTVGNLQKSRHWDTRKAHAGFIFPGYPFRERFPELRSPDTSTLFEVVTREGGHFSAYVDYV